MSDKLPPVGGLVEVTYEIAVPGRTYGNENSIKFWVEEVRPSSFVGGAGIGNRVTTSGHLFTPTSSDGYHADGDERIKMGTNAEWEVVEDPDE